MPEHGVAVTTVGGHDGIQPGIFLMCECGWHAKLAEVTTFDYVAELVSEHRDA